MEATVMAASPGPETAATLAADLGALGVPVGGTVIVHTAMSRLGWVAGGAQGVVDGLTRAVGPDGTLVMTTQTGQLSDPGRWRNPPAPESWWPAIRAGMPAYDPAATPTRMMGAVPECFRSCPGVRRSTHPLNSFAARGPRAGQVLDPHPLEYGLGEGSPLTRLYELGAYVLLLGVDHGSDTVLHLAEHRSGRGREIAGSAPVAGRGWVSFPTLDWDSGDFARLGADYLSAGGEVAPGQVGLAAALLVPVVPLVDYAVGWFREHR